MAYVYRHIRLDTNQPFYIGVGLTDDNFFRARQASKRNKHWKNIANKSSFRVDILFSEIPADEALKKEIEFISIYKRIEDGGTLCNVTLGGEGTLGVKPKNVVPIFGISKDNEVKSFYSYQEAANFIGVSNSQVSAVIHGKSRYCKGWFFSKDIKSLMDGPRCHLSGKHKSHRKNTVSLVKDGNVISFDSYTDAAKHIGSFPNCIGDLFRGKLKSVKGWVLYEVQK
jgi:hypothetical protein